MNLPGEILRKFGGAPKEKEIVQLEGRDGAAQQVA